MITIIDKLSTNNLNRITNNEINNFIIIKTRVSFVVDIMSFNIGYQNNGWVSETSIQNTHYSDVVISFIEPYKNEKDSKNGSNKDKNDIGTPFKGTKEKLDIRYLTRKLRDSITEYKNKNDLQSKLNNKMSEVFFFVRSQVSKKKSDAIITNIVITFNSNPMIVKCNDFDYTKNDEVFGCVKFLHIHDSDDTSTFVKIQI